MPFEVDWRPGAIADVQDLFDYLAEHASLWDARHVTDRLLSSTDKLVEFMRASPLAGHEEISFERDRGPGSLPRVNPWQG